MHTWLCPKITLKLLQNQNNTTLSFFIRENKRSDQIHFEGIPYLNTASGMPVYYLQGICPTTQMAILQYFWGHYHLPIYNHYVSPVSTVDGQNPGPIIGFHTSQLVTMNRHRLLHKSALLSTVTSTFLLGRKTWMSRRKPNTNATNIYQKQLWISWQGISGCIYTMYYEYVYINIDSE